MKSGFTIIEVMIVILISSMFLVGLNRTFIQISRSVTSINRVIAADAPLLPFYNQLERDVTGAFAPKESLRVLGKKYLQDESAEGDGDVAKQAPKETSKEAPKKIIEDVFYIRSENEGEFLWSFITTGGLARLEKDGTLVPQPYVRRVCYKLEKDPEKPNLFRLIYRTESNNLSLNEIEKKNFSPSYVIMRNIKKMSFGFTVFEAVKVDEKTKKPDVKQPQKSVFYDWYEDEVFEKYKTLIPAYVKISGSYTDAVGEKEYPFTFEFKVYAYSVYDPEAEKNISAKDQLQESTEKSKSSLFDQFTKLGEKIGKAKPK